MYPASNSMHIGAARDENAWQNNIIDKDLGAVEHQGRPVPSTKEEGMQLMRLPEAFGPVVCDNLSYTMASVAHVAQQVAGFTGRSLLDACMSGQECLLHEYASQYAQARMQKLVAVPGQERDGTPESQ